MRDLGCFFAFLQTGLHTYSLGWTRAYCVAQGFGRAAILPQLPEPPCLASSSFMTNTCKPTKCNVHTDKNTDYHLMPGEFSPPPKKDVLTDAAPHKEPEHEFSNLICHKPFDKA